MRTAPCVVKVHVARDPAPKILQIGEGMGVEVLVLEDGPERLRRRMVIGGSGPAHGTLNAGTFAHGRDQAIGKLSSPIRVKPNSA